MGFQISLLKFHKNSLSERLLEGKAVTLWDELTKRKAVSLKASFQILPEDIPFFTISPYGLPNITSQIPQEHCSRRVSWGESWNSVRWINRTQSSFSESFFFSFYLRIFPFSPLPSMGFQISLCKFKKNSLSERLLEGKSVTLWDELAHQIQFRRKLL